MSNEFLRSSIGVIDFHTALAGEPTNHYNRAFFYALRKVMHYVTVLIVKRDNQSIFRRMHYAGEEIYNMEKWESTL